MVVLEQCITAKEAIADIVASAIVALEVVPSWVADRIAIVAALGVVRQNTATIEVEDLRIVVGEVAASFIEVE